MMDGKEKLYFLLDAIADAWTITPSGQPLIIDPMNDLNDKIGEVELKQLFTKLEKDEQILRVLQIPSGIKKVEILEDLDPYDPPYQNDDGCWHIELLPAFDGYFSKIQHEPEYQEFTGKKPVGKAVKPSSGTLMTYEQKLDLIVKAVIEARKATRKGQPTTLYLNATSGLDQLELDETRGILLKLQDEKILKLHAETNRLLPLSQQPTDPSYLFVDILEGFDDWYENYLMQQKTGLESIDFINILKIYDVVLDINEQLQLANQTTVAVDLLPHLVRFSILFPTDSIGFRDKYCEIRWNSLKNLKQRGVIDDFKLNDGLHRWQSTVTVSLKLSKFNDFYEAIKDEYIKRNKENDGSEKPQNTPTKINREVSEEAVWSDDFRWEGNDFVFGEYGSIPLQSKDRKYLFKALTDKKGGWTTISELKGNKDAGYVRSTIKQIEDRLPEKAKEHIKIVSTQEDDSIEKPNAGAYRIKVQR